MVASMKTFSYPLCREIKRGRGFNNLYPALSYLTPEMGREVFNSFDSLPCFEIILDKVFLWYYIYIKLIITNINNILLRDLYSTQAKVGGESVLSISWKEFSYRLKDLKPSNQQTLPHLFDDNDSLVIKQYELAKDCPVCGLPMRNKLGFTIKKGFDEKDIKSEVFNPFWGDFLLLKIPDIDSCLEVRISREYLWFEICGRGCANKLNCKFRKMDGWIKEVNLFFLNEREKRGLNKGFKVA